MRTRLFAVLAIALLLNTSAGFSQQQQKILTLAEAREMLQAAETPGKAGQLERGHHDSGCRGAFATPAQNGRGTDRQY